MHICLLNTQVFIFLFLWLLMLPINGSGEELVTGIDKIEIAKITDDGKLIKPSNIDEWNFLGTILGHGYPQDDNRKFSRENPGLIHVVQIEPKAYRYLKQHKKYADGTMLALSFYSTQEKPAPLTDGVVQKHLTAFEIHILDKEKYKDKRAFFIFEGYELKANMIPPGNACVTCHNEEGAFDGTFTQFYPVIRDDILK